MRVQQSAAHSKLYSTGPELNRDPLPTGGTGYPGALDLAQGFRSLTAQFNVLSVTSGDELADKSDEERLTKYAKIFESAATGGLGQNQTLSTLEVFRTRLDDSGGFEQEQIRLRTMVLNDARLKADYQLQCDRIGMECALQIDSCRKENLVLDGQVKFLMQRLECLRAEYDSAMEDANKVHIALKL